MWSEKNGVSLAIDQMMTEVVKFLIIPHQTLGIKEFLFLWIPVSEYQNILWFVKIALNSFRWILSFIIQKERFRITRIRLLITHFVPLIIITGFILIDNSPQNGIPKRIKSILRCKHIYIGLQQIMNNVYKNSLLSETLKNESAW